MPLCKVSELHTTQTHTSLGKWVVNMTKYQLILVSWSLMDTWKRLLLNIIISWSSLKKTSTSKFFIFLRQPLTSTFKILWYLWRKNKMFKVLWSIFSIRRWISYMFTSALSRVKEVLHWTSSDMWKRLQFFMTWPWWTPLFLHWPRKLYIVLGEADWCPNPSVYIDKHNTNASDTRTSDHLQQQCYCIFKALGDLCNCTFLSRMNIQLQNSA